MSRHFHGHSGSQSENAKLDRIFARPDREDHAQMSPLRTQKAIAIICQPAASGVGVTDNAHDDSERADSGEGDGDQGGEEIETEVLSSPMAMSGSNCMKIGVWFSTRRGVRVGADIGGNPLSVIVVHGFPKQRYAV
ncbi:hypothetical protein Q5P01_000566 [Channa striata]|uniref:Uncharacterized protein n=1 Tax=Channa striata TaxID=64152 RepID=A0AA88IGR6_CHASR|nr:hypothetical protein Q5P01_000566 [Channa striata]